MKRSLKVLPTPQCARTRSRAAAICRRSSSERLGKAMVEPNTSRGAWMKAGARGARSAVQGGVLSGSKVIDITLRPGAASRDATPGITAAGSTRAVNRTHTHVGDTRAIALPVSRA
ncbi:hypothetical protein [Sphingomonas phyllosphaerae]|uniref:hypothetical protein n=1 Tax=Sphingomonas phyllosphaerae TaxID=257003 RepID=UPI0024131F9B|nr:hypothetical protein [Sphingomonas phyllosphaerae]